MGALAYLRSSASISPRGTGKSTWLNGRYKEALVVDLLGPAEFRQYNSRPERLIELVEGHPKTKTVIIDEVQRAPGLLPSYTL